MFRGFKGMRRPPWGMREARIRGRGRRSMRARSLGEVLNLVLDRDRLLGASYPRGDRLQLLLRGRPLAAGEIIWPGLPQRPVDPFELQFREGAIAAGGPPGVLILIV